MKTAGLITGLLLSSTKAKSAFITYSSKAPRQVFTSRVLDDSYNIYSKSIPQSASLKAFAVDVSEYNSKILQPKISLPKVKKPRIAVIDDFLVKKIDLNGDGEKDLPHGNIVLAILKAKTNSHISVFTNDKDVKILTEFIPEQIDKILKKDKFDAVNISAGFETSLRILSIKTGIKDLTPENLNKNKEKIRKYILETGFNNCDKVIRSIEKLTSKGVKVYVAAGNKQSEYANLFSFAKGVKVIGALDKTGSMLESSASNSMLEYTRGIYRVQNNIDSHGKAIYFLTDDKSFSVKLPKPFGITKRKMTKINSNIDNTNVFVKGTSFATPTKLADDLNNNLQKKVMRLKSHNHMVREN